jgi:ABC-type glutathione transport system ATPase component
MALLEGRNLFKTFSVEGGVLRRRIGSVQALKNVSFQVQKGETLAVVGGSGCGKTTLAKLIAGLLPLDAGQLLWEGAPLENLSRLERAHRIQMVFQDPFASLNPKLSIGTQIAEVVRTTAVIASEPASELEKHGERGNLSRFERLRLPRPGLPLEKLEARPRNDIHRQCIALMESVGLGEDALDHYPFQFSGGQRQRIAIARALAMRPALLIADEPLSALDVTVQAQMLELFRRLKSDYALTLLFITHDLAVVQDFADRVIVLHDGAVAEEGLARELLSRPQTPYTRALLEAVPRLPC